MIVKDVLKKIGIESDDIREVKGLSFDSRYIEDGYIFVAYRGNDSDGNDYISKAFEKGAVCVISDRLVGYDIYKSNDINKAKEILTKTIYKINKIKLIGITGTNGKTSSAHLIYQTLNNMGIKATYIGTLGVIDRDYFLELDNTTPNMDVLSREILKAKKRKCEYVIMEVSSHSLGMNRVNIFNFDIVAFTNFTQDHLDYYKNMEAYFNDKKLLFDKASKSSIGIINNEDSASCAIIKDFKGKVIRYGHDSEYDYKIIKNEINNLIIEVNGEVITSNLIYKTNVYNILLAYVVILSLGYKKEIIIDSLKKATTINGRMEKLYSNEYHIILDYAHTPDAMERILSETNKIKEGKCVVLFGCGGNRDRLKRPIMGSIADKYADEIYITNDNPRYEDEKLIVKDILKGIENIDKVKVNYNREKAIKEAISSLDKNDILLILGKGHEEYQIIKNQKINLSDREIVKLCLER